MTKSIEPGDVKRPVISVVEPDPRWPDMFRSIEVAVRAALGGLEVAVEHVGSTSVPGLKAKPIIDVDVVVEPEDVKAAIAALEGIGYEHQGDKGIVGREAFMWPEGWFAHHLYVCAVGAAPLRAHLLLRDWLRSHPEDARAYGDLKTRLVGRLGHDRAAYTEAKTDFILGLVAKATCEEARARPEVVEAQIEAAYACDRCGLEAEAVVFYDAAHKLGVPEEGRADFLVGYGSTLRNVGRVEASVEVLQGAVQAYPASLPLKAFLSLSLHSASRHGEAMAVILGVALELNGGERGLDGYERALAHYRDELGGLQGV